MGLCDRAKREALCRLLMVAIYICRFVSRAQETPFKVIAVERRGDLFVAWLDAQDFGDDPDRVRREAWS